MRNGRVSMVVVLLAGMLALADSSPAPAAAASGASAPTIAVGYDGHVVDASHDGASGLTYATTASTDDEYPSSLIAFDAGTGLVAWHLPLQGSPASIAVADDGSKIYVGLRNRTKISRIDVASRELDLTIQLANDVTDWFAVDMAVLPGSPSSVAVAYANDSTPTHGPAGLAVFDDRTRRSVEPADAADHLHFTSANTLYGINRDHELTEYAVDPDGLTAVGSWELRLGHGPASYIDGRLVTSDGDVVDLEARTRLADLDSGTGLAPALEGDRYYTLSIALREIRGWDATSFARSGDGLPITIPGDALGLVATPDGIYAWATEGAVRPRPAPALRRWPALNEAVHDPVSDTIFGASAADSSVAPNSVLAIDPSDDSVMWSVWVGSEPQQMALSDDGTKLYVELFGSSEIARVDIATRSVDLRFPLGSDDFGPYVAADLETLAGSPDSVVVARERVEVSPAYGGIVVFDAGVPRPDTMPGHGGARELVVAGPTRILGYEDRWLSVIDITPDGAELVEQIRADLHGWQTRIRLSGDRIWSTRGAIVDAATGDGVAQIPWEVGELLDVGPAEHGGKMYFVRDAHPVPTIQAHDLGTYAEVGERVEVSSPGGWIIGFLVTDHGPFVWSSEGFGRASNDSPLPYDGLVQGRVTDAATGRSIAYACVTLFDGRYLYETETDFSGLWNIRVEAGDYIILVVDCQGRTHFSEFHLDVPVRSPEPADAVRVRVGRDEFIDTALSPVFYDLRDSRTFWLDIFWLRDTGITTGCAVAFYCPKDAVTREQMASFVARFWRYTYHDCPGGPMPFLDVVSTSFAYRDVICIFGLQITTGTSPTAYSPKETVSREQMAAFVARLWRALGGTCPEGGHPFLDVGSSFAVDDIACIFQLGITTGTSATTYSPSDPVTREQMAAFLSRLDQRLT